MDEDPEDLITFDATTAIPLGKRGHRKKRGEEIIDFFQLNQRQELHQGRALIITVVGNALTNVAANKAVKTNKQTIEAALSDGVPHANCARAFHAVWDKNRNHAKRIHQSCQELWNDSILGIT